ncbi:bifunctional diguanylate cyclase/phosphodiesterase [Pseudomonas matsuisoli]|uniref:GGDEF domain-containing protein n=1 Tax=Pseudomonas matsuisoli TaxID=1515666 RepID=A0A917V0I1_9PSED|nr:EAL domain-containing protein [Pseudomonas matsuisoli]GGK05001.1 GGDEF domain-containing protein [Pseudomonas matsuisoli]
MSLFKQLFLGICLFLVIAFTGSFLASLESSRDQSIEQLQSHAQDAATALAMTLTPNIDDPAMVDLLVSSIFDSGYYDRIRVLDVQNGDRVITERTSANETSDVPAWFERLVRIDAQPAEAVVMRGWDQAARVQVSSHPRFAITRLWDSAMGSLAWLLGCGVVAAVLGGLLLRAQLRPLDYLVRQSEAIAIRQFLSVPELPRTPELRRVVGAMNLMVEKLKAVFQEQAERSEQLRDEAYLDSLTGLANRRRLDLQMEQSLSSDEQASHGAFLMVRLDDLAGVNGRLGGHATDDLLRRIADALRRHSRPALGSEGLVARSRGGQFAILAPGLLGEEAERLAAALVADLQKMAQGDECLSTIRIHVGVTLYRIGDSPKALLVRVDDALAAAAWQGDFVWSSTGDGSAGRVTNEQDTWRTRLDTALRERRFILYFQPVKSLTAPGGTLQYKALARLLNENGDVVNAGRFLPWIERFGWSERLDTVMLDLLLEQMKGHDARMSLSLSRAAVADERARETLIQQLSEHPEVSRRLTLELDEQHLPDQAGLEALAMTLRSLTGTGLAIQHFGGRFSLIGNLARLGLDYLKLDGSYIRHIDVEADKRLFVEAVQQAASSINLPVIAERVETQGELDVLREMNIAGATGERLGVPEPWNS